jgi:AmmeMemoRadiSam system protein A
VNFELSAAEREELLKIARASMEAAVKGESYHLARPKFEILKSPAGAFVTLKNRSGLRGCLGIINAVYPLYETVSQMAVEAALRDPRFSPVTDDEIPGIEIEISVLTPPVLIRDTQEIAVGKHGLIIEKNLCRGLLLPQVATEYRWNREEFLKHTCLKAGLPEDSFKDPDAKIYVFSAIVFHESEIKKRNGGGTR